jgi:Helix-turn-helix domain
MSKPLSRWIGTREFAQQLGVDVMKILGWIRTGELAAINVSTDPSSRPRWRLSPEAIDEFLARRRAQQPVKTQRKRKMAGVIEFY